MSDAKIRVIVKRPDEKYGHVTHMSNTLQAFQKAVDGPIETISIVPQGIVCIVNEEGKLRNLEPNFYMGRAPFGDRIVGTAVIVGTDGEEFCDCPIDFYIWKSLIDIWGIKG